VSAFSFAWMSCVVGSQLTANVFKHLFERLKKRKRCLLYARVIGRCPA